MSKTLIFGLGFLVAILSAQAIVGGRDATQDDLITRHMVAIHNGTSVCGASILSSRVLLTAAHCVKDVTADKLIIAPTLNIFSIEPSKKIYAESRLTVEEDTQGSDLTDIAIIRLKADLPADYEPITLWQGADVPGPLYIAGYGYITQMNHEGAGLLRVVDILFKSADSDMLTFDQSSGHGGCKGDSGSPIYVQKDNTVYEVALMHGAFPDPSVVPALECHQLSQGVKLAPHMDWLRKQVPELKTL